MFHLLHVHQCTCSSIHANSAISRTLLHRNIAAAWTTTLHIDSSCYCWNLVVFIVLFNSFLCTVKSNKQAWAKLKLKYCTLSWMFSFFTAMQQKHIIDSCNKCNNSSHTSLRINTLQCHCSFVHVASIECILKQNVPLKYSHVLIWVEE